MLTIKKLNSKCLRTKVAPYPLCRCCWVALVRAPAAAATAVALMRGPGATAAAIAHVRGQATAAVATDAVAWRSHQRSHQHSQRHSHGPPARLPPPGLGSRPPRRATDLRVFSCRLIVVFVLWHNVWQQQVLVVARTAHVETVAACSTAVSLAPAPAARALATRGPRPHAR